METISREEFELGIDILYETDPNLKKFLLDEFLDNKDYRKWIINTLKKIYDPFWRVHKKTDNGILLPTIHDFNGDIITIDNIDYCRVSLTPELFTISSFNHLESYQIDFERNKDFFHLDLITLPITQKFLTLLTKVK